ncbi:MAG: Ribosomal RNA small subunit methyltransferase F [Candidatus Woesearchaeota archaeon]|nr:Ribosomal RNA small subunit methyltransferase F [Candidatus Woesearchaeota archaeon]
MRYKILNTRDVKEINNLIEKQWGVRLDLNLAFLKKKFKIYVVSRTLGKIDFTKLRINNVGMYFGHIKNNEIRLSIEGSMIVGPLAEKNILEISDWQLQGWLNGEELEAKNKNHSFVLIKHKDDFVGCGKQIGNRVLNYVPKARRVQLA